LGPISVTEVKTVLAQFQPRDAKQIFAAEIAPTEEELAIDRQIVEFCQLSSSLTSSSPVSRLRSPCVVLHSRALHHYARLPSRRSLHSGIRPVLRRFVAEVGKRTAVFKGTATSPLGEGHVRSFRSSLLGLIATSRPEQGLVFPDRRGKFPVRFTEKITKRPVNTDDAATPAGIQTENSLYFFPVHGNFRWREVRRGLRQTPTNQ